MLPGSLLPLAVTSPMFGRGFRREPADLVCSGLIRNETPRGQQFRPRRPLLGRTRGFRMPARAPPRTQPTTGALTPLVPSSLTRVSRP